MVGTAWRRATLARRAATLARRWASPARRSATLARRAATLARRWASPARRSAILARRSASLARRSASLARRWACLARRWACLARRWACLARRSASPAWRSAILPRQWADAARKWAGSLWREHRLITIAVALSLLPRALAMLAFRPALFTPDSFGYLAEGVRFAPGSTRPSGYPILLLALQPFHSLALVTGVQHLLGIATAVVGYAVLRRWGLPGWGAALAACPTLFDPRQVALESSVLPDTLYALLLMLAAALLLTRRQPGPRRCALAGLALAWAAVTRGNGLPEFAGVLAVLLIQRVGWRSVTAATASFALPVLGYMAVFDLHFGAFALTDSSGMFLWSRTMSFANCAVIKPPAPLRPLCPDRQARHPAGPEPAWSAPALLTARPPAAYLWAHSAWWRHDARPGITMANNALATRFALAAIRAQPGDYLRTVTSGVMLTFLATDRARGAHNLQFTPVPDVPKLQPIQLRHLREYAGGAGDTHQVQPYAYFLYLYQEPVYFPGIAFLLIMLAGIAGVVRRWRMPGDGEPGLGPKLAWRHHPDADADRRFLWRGPGDGEPGLGPKLAWRNGPDAGAGQRFQWRPRAGWRRPGTWRPRGGPAAVPWVIAAVGVVVPVAIHEYHYRYAISVVPVACLAAGLAFAREAGRGTPAAPQEAPGRLAVTTVPPARAPWDQSPPDHALPAGPGSPLPNGAGQASAPPGSAPLTELPLWPARRNRAGERGDTRPVAGCGFVSRTATMWSFLGRHRVFAVAFAIGLALRVVTVLGFPPAIWFGGDSASYLSTALRLQPGTSRLSGYGLGLLLLRPFHSFAVVTAVQHLMGLAAAIMIYALLRRYGLPGWGATLAALPVLLDAYQLQLEHEILPSAAFSFLIMTALTLVLWWRGKRPMWATVSAGLVLASAATMWPVGLPMLIIYLLYLVLRRVGWRALAATALAGAVPLAGYLLWFDLGYHRIAFTNADGIFLWSRTMSFANCAVIKPPADEAGLCPRQPVSQRPSASAFIWEHNSPLFNVLPGQSRFSPQRNTLAMNFAERAILAQPFSYANSVLHGFALNFSWKIPDHPSAAMLRRYEFKYAYKHWIPATAEIARGHSVASDQLAYGGETSTRMVAPFATWMVTYQRYVYLPGTLLGVAMLIGLGGVIRAWRRGGFRRLADWGGPGLYPWLASLALLLVPVMTADYSKRYALIAVPVVCLAAGLAFARRDETPQPDPSALPGEVRETLAASGA